MHSWSKPAPKPSYSLLPRPGSPRVPGRVMPWPALPEAGRKRQRRGRRRFPEFVCQGLWTNPRSILQQVPVPPGTAHPAPVLGYGHQNTASGKFSRWTERLHLHHDSTDTPAPFWDAMGCHRMPQDAMGCETARNSHRARPAPVQVMARSAQAPLRQVGEGKPGELLLQARQLCG